MKKIICNQCKECQLPYLPNNKIPCSDTDCKCHTVKQGGRYNKTYILEEKLEHVTISATTKRPYEHQTANTTQQQQQYQRQGYSNGGRGYSNGGRGNNNRNNNGGRGTEDPRWKAWRDKKKPEWQGKMICRNMIWFGKCEGPCSQTLHRFPPNTSQSIRSAIEQHIREMPHAANPYKH